MTKQQEKEIIEAICKVPTSEWHDNYILMLNGHEIRINAYELKVRRLDIDSHYSIIDGLEPIQELFNVLNREWNERIANRENKFQEEIYNDIVGE